MKSTFLNNEVPGQEILLAFGCKLCKSHCQCCAHTAKQGCVKARTIKISSVLFSFWTKQSTSINAQKSAFIHWSVTKKIRPGAGFMSRQLKAHLSVSSGDVHVILAAVFVAVVVWSRGSCITSLKLVDLIHGAILMVKMLWSRDENMAIFQLGSDRNKQCTILSVSSLVEVLSKLISLVVSFSFWDDGILPRMNPNRHVFLLDTRAHINAFNGKPGPQAE